jgi:hypothetical protein
MQNAALDSATWYGGVACRSGWRASFGCPKEQIAGSLPATVGCTANYRASAIAQLNLHLQHVQARHLDMMCYAEHYAQNSPIAELSANVTSIIQSL